MGEKVDGFYRWKSMPSVTEFLVPSMTPAMGELLFTMKTIVASQRERLLVVLFTRHIVGLMDALDRIFFDEVFSFLSFINLSRNFRFKIYFLIIFFCVVSQVILSNAFSTGGAAQVKYDIVSNFAVSLNRMTQLPNAGLARYVSISSLYCFPNVKLHFECSNAVGNCS